MDTTTKKCFICGALIINSSIPACAACRQKDADTLLKAQAFHQENPTAKLIEIAQITKIPYSTISWYFNNGKLGYTQRTDHNGPDWSYKGISISDTIYGEYIWLEVSGKVDSANALSLQQYMDLLIGDGWVHFIIDMNAVSFFSSTGIRVIMSAYKKLHELDGSLKITNPSLNVKNVLGMVALDTLLL